MGTTASKTEVRTKGNSFICRSAPESPRERERPRGGRAAARVEVQKKGSTPSARDRGGGSGTHPKGTCDRCDGPHLTDECPIFKKPRDNHPDATRRKPPELGRPGGNFVLHNARVVRQPGDGSCLFHSMAYGMGSGDARSLRREIAKWIAANPDLTIADTPVSDWVKWDSGRSVAQYARSIGVSGWGGGMEMAACARLRGINVHVYEKRSSYKGGGYQFISCFDVRSARKTIHVLYQGGVHYDALVPY